MLITDVINNLTISYNYRTSLISSGDLFLQYEYGITGITDDTYRTQPHFVAYRVYTVTTFTKHSLLAYFYNDMVR